MDIGILMHVYNVQDPHWEYIAWGDPETNLLGCLPKLCELLLMQPSDITTKQIIIFSGPSTKNNLSEGAYTKQFLMDHLDELALFPSLKPLLKNNHGKLSSLKRHVENITLGQELVRTMDEIVAAAQFFDQSSVEAVAQIACASHAPRCMQQQVVARSQGTIPRRQVWSVIASDTCFPGSKPEDTIVFEKPHLDYDPMAGFVPDAPEVLRGYFSLSPQDKRKFLVETQAFMENHRM